MMDREVDDPCNAKQNNRENPSKRSPPQQIRPLRRDERPPEASGGSNDRQPAGTIPEPLSILRDSLNSDQLRTVQVGISVQRYQLLWRRAHEEILVRSPQPDGSTAEAFRSP